MKNITEDIIVGLDIGSTKIIITIAELDEYGNLFVSGIGEVKNKTGMRNGVVVNIESIATAINKAVEEAEIQAGREIKGVYVGVSGSNIETINSKGVVAISGNDKEIKESDIERVIEAAKAVAIPMDRDVLHIIPQGFTVDGQANIRYPIGMVGTRLECQIHMLTTPISSIQNVVKCLERCGIEIYDIVLQNLAASKAVLEEDEKEVGILMLDVGAETTKASIYYQQAPYYQSIYPLGGYLITNDIAAGLKISLSDAEKIKLAFGVTHFELVDREEAIQIPSIGGRKPRIIARQNLVHIIRPRVEEMLNIIKQDITQKGYMDKINGGIVFTGGSANVPGIIDVCQEIFDLPVRPGTPKTLGGISEKVNTYEFAVINGLIRWGYDKATRSGMIHKNNKESNTKGFLSTIKKIFDELF